VKDYWTATGSAEVDRGRFEDTQNDVDEYVFRVSMLRNIAKTGPYFHDGSVRELTQAVHIMADVQLGVPLTDADAGDIVDFLDALTGQVPAHFSSP
jgi:cytochrome c peroxidase